MANWVRQRRQNHQTGHGQTADLFAKIRPKGTVLTGLILRCIGHGRQTCYSHS